MSAALRLREDYDARHLRALAKASTPAKFWSRLFGLAPARSLSLIFAVTLGKPNCYGEVVSALACQHGGLDAAAAALGYSSVQQY